MKPVFFPEKDPEEIVLLTFDFTNDLQGALISGAAVVTIATYSGIDATPASVLNGPATIDPSNTKVLQGVKAGLADCDYRIKVKVPTNAGGGILTMARILPVRNA